MNRFLLVIGILVIYLCYNFKIFDNNKGITNCLQEGNLSNNYFKDIHRHANKENTSSYIMSGVNNETKEISIEVSHVLNNSSGIVGLSGGSHCEKNVEQVLNLSTNPEADVKLSYLKDKINNITTVPNEEINHLKVQSKSVDKMPYLSGIGEKIPTVPTEESLLLESSTENIFFSNFNLVDKNEGNINLLHSSNTSLEIKMSNVINKSETSSLPSNQVYYNTQPLFESTTDPNFLKTDLKINGTIRSVNIIADSFNKNANAFTQPNDTSTLIKTKSHCSIATNFSSKAHRDVQDTRYTYIQEIYTLVQEIYGKLEQVYHFATELKKELEDIQKHQILITQSEDQTTHTEGCILDEQYQPNLKLLEDLKWDNDFHEVKTRMIDIDKLFNIFEDLYRNGNQKSKVFHQAGLEILKAIKTVNTLINHLQQEFKSFLGSIPEFKVKCN